MTVTTVKIFTEKADTGGDLRRKEKRPKKAQTKSKGGTGNIDGKEIMIQTRRANSDWSGKRKEGKNKNIQIWKICPERKL